MSVPPTWTWNLPGETDAVPPDGPGSAGSEPQNRQHQGSASSEPEQQEHPPPSGTDRETRGPKQKHYGPRTCRICLETEQPRYPSDVASTLGISSSSSRPWYESDDAELGRLLSPCKCKGSQKYVHEGCLNAWRRANPMAARNYWQCPTCKFNYRLARLHWASMLGSQWAQVALTLVAVVVGIFLLGFIADPVLDLWFDPVGTISDTVTSVVSDVEARGPPRYEESTSWADHFAKGFFSLGLVGFLKSLVAMGPWQWLNLRTSYLLGSGRRRAGTGRARMDNFNLVFVIIGALTFLMAIWKAVRAVSTRVLNNVRDKVLDIGDDDDDGEEEDEQAKDEDKVEGEGEGEGESGSESKKDQ